MGKGRIFTFDSLNPDGSTLEYQQIYQIFSKIHAQIDDIPPRDYAVPTLSADDRTAWAKVSILQNI